MPYAIDLFCGAGGVSEGLIQAGFHILFSSDINKQVEVTYKNRHEQLGLVQGFNTHYERMDIRNLTGDFIIQSINNLTDDVIPSNPQIDAVFGGPPCQGFSLAGKRKQNDPRNFLFKEYLRVISEISPNYVVMENVEGFITTKLLDFSGLDNEQYKGMHYVVKILLNEFKKIGYKTLEPQLLDASDFGVPQRRNRAIFVAYLPDCKAPTYPQSICSDNEKFNVSDAISDLISDNRKRRKYCSNTSAYQRQSIEGRTKRLDGQQLPPQHNVLNYEFAKHDDYIVERFSLFKKGEDTATLKKRIKGNGISIASKKYLLKLLMTEDSTKLSRSEYIKVFKDGKATNEMINILLTKKNNRKRIDASKCSPTMVTLPDDYISPYENRIFTVREMARLQSFDDSFEFLGKRTTGGQRRKEEVPQYSQVGNAVPPLLSKAIANEIIRAIKMNQ